MLYLYFIFNIDDTWTSALFVNLQMPSCYNFLPMLFGGALW